MSDISHSYEGLGHFYLGRYYDIVKRELDTTLAGLNLYESKDLVTHAVIVGMTGSGKTGLGVSLLEEAAIDGIPGLIVDPKGDLTNLLLNFPSLRPSDFQRWINPDDARRAGKSVEDFAAEQASNWRQGLADWDQSPERIQKLADSCDFNIYTPGSDAGIPVSILSSFATPPPSVLDDVDLLRDRIATTATSVLALLGIDADPINSREHILLTTILDHCWRNRQSLDIGSLIQMVQTPPVQKIGVMDLESFFSAKERFALAMKINNLLASPGFSAWMSGQPLDVDQLLHSPAGKPRMSILYIAHLSEQERMFFVSLLLNQVLAWMRSRPGTTSLRALLYIDEIFGYMPPVAEPPTKKPLLTLLKQARAYGLGLVLATQNPVDLDYKGLSNTGTWFLGRLQTDQDKQRVLDGLEGASNEAGGLFDRQQMDEILSGVGKRIFLMHNVHDSHPKTFHTRWALSYLPGPLTRSQIKTLMQGKKAEAPTEEPAALMQHATTEVAAITAQPGTRQGGTPPVLPPKVPQVYLPLRRAAGVHEITYEPRLLAVGKVHFVDTRRDLAADEDLMLLANLENSAFGIDWDKATSIDVDLDDIAREPAAVGQYGNVPVEATQPPSYKTWEKALEDFIYRSHRYQLFRCKALSSISEPGETERDFRIRLTELAHEERDEKIEKLRDKYASRIATAEERIRKAQLRVEREEQQVSGAKFQSMLSTGAAVLSMVLGRRALGASNVRRAASAARGHGRIRAQADDVRRAESDVNAYEEKLEEIESKLEEAVQELSEQFDVHSLEIDALLLKPRKSDIQIRHIALAWAPFTTDSIGAKVPLFL